MSLARYAPVLLFIAATVVAATAGYGGNLVLASYLAPSATLSVARVEAPSSRRQADVDPGEAAEDGPAGLPAAMSGPGRSEATYLASILGRNLFDPNAIGGAGEPEPADEEIPDGEVRSELNVRLLATIVATPAAYSSALIQLDGGKGDTNGYGVGDELEGAKVVEISDRKVVFERDGRLEYISLDEQVEAAPDSGRRRRPRGDDDGDGAITKLGDNKYEVDRSVLEQLQDIDKVARMARARPHKDADGNQDGFRLSGIRRSKLPYKLGIKNGDVVHSVNGQPLTSMAEAMSAYGSLSATQNFSFEITRRGQRMKLEYNVR